MNFKGSILILGLSLSLFSCVKRDTITSIPTLSYEDFTAVDENTAYLTINYTDGDGDIFAEEDVKDPNFFAWFYFKDTDGEFKPALWPLAIPNPPKPDTIIYNNRPLSYTIERPSELSKNQPIKGRITITMIGWRSDSKYKNFKYKIYMIDQKGNKTEEIFTPETITPF